MFATLSMAYRVLLIVPTNPPNWLLVLPPKNRLNTCSVSIQVFWSIFIDLIWSSRFKIMINSNLKLLQLRFMIYQLWYQLWLILGVIMVKIISLVCRIPKVTINFGIRLFPLDFSNGLQTHRSLNTWTPWLTISFGSVLLLCISKGFSKKSAVYPHNCGYPVRILR
jgi:hypothetical protein